MARRFTLLPPTALTPPSGAHNTSRDQANGAEIVALDVVQQRAAGKDFPLADIGESEPRGFEDRVWLFEVRWREDGQDRDVTMDIEDAPPRVPLVSEFSFL